MICEALRTRPKHMGTRLAPRVRSLTRSRPRRSTASCTSPTACSPTRPPPAATRDAEERASFEQIAMATLMRGVHW